MNKYVELDKRSKKEKKAYYKKQRVTNGFNTGTRDMKTAKLPTRAMNKKDFKKELDNADF